MKKDQLTELRGTTELTELSMKADLTGRRQAGEARGRGGRIEGKYSQSVPKNSPHPDSVHSVVPRNSVKKQSGLSLKGDSAVLRVTRHLERRKRLARDSVPRIDSFFDFLTRHARVKSGSGYVPYHFRGREALLPIVRQLDAMLASGEPDASLALCGGAQFGKTVLMLNLLAYLVAVRFRNVG